MNDLENRRFQEHLNKEKKGRREWALHDKQQQVFGVQSDEFNQLLKSQAVLAEACAEPTRTTNEGIEKRPSRRKQLVAIRDTLRGTLAAIDKKLETVDQEHEEDPYVAAAKAAAQERLKLPPHMRGNAVLG